MHLYRSPFLHAEGLKLREGGFTITRTELLQSQQPQLLVSIAAIENWMNLDAQGFGVCISCKPDKVVKVGKSCCCSYAFPNEALQEIEGKMNMSCK